MSESISIQDRLLSPRRALADDVADMTESIVQRLRETAATRLSLSLIHISEPTRPY